MYLVLGSFTSCHDFEFYQSFAVAYTDEQKPYKAARLAYMPKDIAREIRAAVATLKNPELFQLEFRAENGRAVWQTWRLVPYGGPPGSCKPVAQAEPRE